MRRLGHNGRVDANQKNIVDVLRAMGATVQSLAGVGKGCPDLLVGWRGDTYLMECKDGTKPKSKQQLTDDQGEWIENWRGSKVHVVHSADEAAAVLTWGHSSGQIPTRAHADGL